MECNPDTCFVAEKAVLDSLKQLGISKVVLVVFEKNWDGNAFWEEQDFTIRTDLTYSNKSLVQMTRIDT